MSKSKNQKKIAERRELEIRARALNNSGYSIPEIAKVLEVSEGLVKDLLKGEENDYD